MLLDWYASEITVNDGNNTVTIAFTVTPCKKGQEPRPLTLGEINTIVGKAVHYLNTYVHVED